MKRMFCRLFSVLLAMCMLMSSITVTAEEEYNEVEEQEKTYIQPVEISSADTQTLTTEEVRHYSEISNELTQDNSEGTVTVEGEDSFIVYSIKDDDTSTIQEFTYTTDDNAVMSLTSYSEITLEENVDGYDQSIEDQYSYEYDTSDDEIEILDEESIDSANDANEEIIYSEAEPTDYNIDESNYIVNEQMEVDEDYSNENDPVWNENIVNIEAVDDIETYADTIVNADNTIESDNSDDMSDVINDGGELEEKEDISVYDPSDEEEEFFNEQPIVIDEPVVIDEPRMDILEESTLYPNNYKENDDTMIDSESPEESVEDLVVSVETELVMEDGQTVENAVTTSALMAADVNVMGEAVDKSAANDEFDDEYKNTNQTIITAERLLEMIETGDEFAITFANKLGFGRTANEIAGNLRSMVTEYHDQVNSGNSSFQEPKFIINGVDIVLNRTIEEVSLTKNDDGTYSAVLNGNGDQTGYRTSVMVDADASVTIVYDQHGEAKIERRVSSGKPTDFVITLDVSGSMADDGRDGAMKSALKVVLDEILQVKENTVSIVFWASDGEVMQINVDDGGISRVFSGADGMTVEKLFDAKLTDHLGNISDFSLSDATIGQIESLYNTDSGTEPDKGLANAYSLLKAMQRESDRNVGVLMFTDGQVWTSGWWWDREYYDTISEKNTIDYEKRLAEEFDAKIVNVSIGDEYDVKQYERYLDPNSDSYYERDNQVLKEHVLYYNIPKLTDQELADRVSEMFEIAFEDITTETTELKTETITDGILAAYASQLIQTIPDGFELVEIRGTDNSTSYQVVGTDADCNTMISYNLDSIISGKDTVVSYCVIPTKADNDIGVTAYADKADTVLHAQPVDRIDVPEADKTVLIRSTKHNDHNPQRPSIIDETIHTENTKYLGGTTLAINGYRPLDTLQSYLNSQDRLVSVADLINNEGFDPSLLPNLMKNYYDPEHYKESYAWQIAKHNTDWLQGEINEKSERATKDEAIYIHLDKGEFIFAPGGTYSRDNEISYVIKCASNVVIKGAGMGETILRPIGCYPEQIESDKIKELYETGMLQANYRGMDMFYFNEYEDQLAAIAKIKGEVSEADKKNCEVFLENVSFEDFTIDGQSAKAAVTGVWYSSAGKGFMINLMRDVDWKNVEVKNTDGTGFGVDCPISCTMDGCVATGCGKAAAHIGHGGSGFGIGVGYSKDETMTIRNCYAQGNGKNGFFFENQDEFNRGKQWKYDGNNESDFDREHNVDDYRFKVENCKSVDNLFNFAALASGNVEYCDCESIYTDKNQTITTDLLNAVGGRKGRKDIINDLKTDFGNYSDHIDAIDQPATDETGIFFGVRSRESFHCTFTGTEKIGESIQYFYGDNRLHTESDELNKTARKRDN